MITKEVLFQGVKKTNNNNKQSQAKPCTHVLKDT